MMMDKETQSTTQFNMSIATLMRIDKLLSFVNTFRVVRNNPLRICNALEGVFLEVYPFLSKEDKAQGKARLIEINNCFVVEQGELKAYNRVTDLLFKFEFWLREKLEETGLLMAKSDDPSRALGGG